MLNRTHTPSITSVEAFAHLCTASFGAHSNGTREYLPKVAVPAASLPFLILDSYRTLPFSAYAEGCDEGGESCLELTQALVADLNHACTAEHLAQALGELNPAVVLVEGLDSTYSYRGDMPTLAQADLAAVVARTHEIAAQALRA